jgi:hypothetical protein
MGNIDFVRTGFTNQMFFIVVLEAVHQAVVGFVSMVTLSWSTVCEKICELYLHKFFL